MDPKETPRPQQQAVLNRFVAACQADERVVAALLGGSYASGAADAYSDLDLFLITTDETYDKVVAGREDFIRQLGEPVFLEDFGIPGSAFFILSEGTEVELWFFRESEFRLPHVTPYKALVDKTGILVNVVFASHEEDHSQQIEMLRRLVHWFWHDLSHFITAMARGQLWWAYGQLWQLRLACVNLARLRQDLLDADVGEEGYFKVDQVLPAGQLSALQSSCCAMEQNAMLRAVHVILRLYQQLAPPLAEEHAITYPDRLERIIVKRLSGLGDPSPKVKTD